MTVQRIVLFVHFQQYDESKCTVVGMFLAVDSDEGNTCVEKVFNPGGKDRGHLSG